MRKNKSIRLGDIAEGKDISGKKICFRVNRIELATVIGVKTKETRTILLDCFVLNPFLTAAVRAIREEKKGDSNE